MFKRSFVLYKLCTALETHKLSEQIKQQKHKCENNSWYLRCWLLHASQRKRKIKGKTDTQSVSNASFVIAFKQNTMSKLKIVKLQLLKA